MDTLLPPVKHKQNWVRTRCLIRFARKRIYHNLPAGSIKLISLKVHISLEFQNEGRLLYQPITMYLSECFNPCTYVKLGVRRRPSPSLPWGPGPTTPCCRGHYVSPHSKLIKKMIECLSSYRQRQPARLTNMSGLVTVQNSWGGGNAHFSPPPLCYAQGVY